MRRAKRARVKRFIHSVLSTVAVAPLLAGLLRIFTLGASQRHQRPIEKSKTDRNDIGYNPRVVYRYDHIFLKSLYQCKR